MTSPDPLLVLPLGLCPQPTCRSFPGLPVLGICCVNRAWNRVWIRMPVFPGAWARGSFPASSSARHYHPLPSSGLLVLRPVGGVSRACHWPVSGRYGCCLARGEPRLPPTGHRTHGVFEPCSCGSMDVCSEPGEQGVRGSCPPPTHLPSLEKKSFSFSVAPHCSHACVYEWTPKPES